MRFETDYHNDEGVYWTTLFARNRLHAENIVVQRRMKESVHSQISPLMYDQTGETIAKPEVLFPSELIALGRWAQALHAACWLGMIAASSGCASAFSLLSDRGIVHSLAHVIDIERRGEMHKGAAAASVVQAYCKAVRLEGIVPGFTRYEGDESREVGDIRPMMQRALEFAPVWFFFLAAGLVIPPEIESGSAI